MISSTPRPATRSFTVRKNTRRMSGVKSKSQWNTLVFIVPAEVMRIAIAVRRLVCTNCTARTSAPAPPGEVDTAANRVMPAKSRDTPSSSFCGSYDAESRRLSMVRLSSGESGRRFMSRSTYTRYPFCEGMRPADVCGCRSSPRSASSLISLRTVAEETVKSRLSQSILEPAGSPVAI